MFFSWDQILSTLSACWTMRCVCIGRLEIDATEWEHSSKFYVAHGAWWNDPWRQKKKNWRNLGQMKPMSRFKITQKNLLHKEIFDYIVFSCVLIYLLNLKIWSLQHTLNFLTIKVITCSCQTLPSWGE